MRVFCNILLILVPIIFVFNWWICTEVYPDWNTQSTEWTFLRYRIYELMIMCIPVLGFSVKNKYSKIISVFAFFIMLASFLEKLFFDFDSTIYTIIYYKLFLIPIVIISLKINDNYADRTYRKGY